MKLVYDCTYVSFISLKHSEQVRNLSVTRNTDLRFDSRHQNCFVPSEKFHFPNQILKNCSMRFSQYDWIILRLYL